MVRVRLTGRKTIFKSEIIEVRGRKELVGSYKKIIKKLYRENVNIILMQEYNKHIVNYAQKFGIIVEDEFEIIPEKIRKIIESTFEEKGGLSVGLFFYDNEELGKKITKEIIDFVRVLYMQNFSGSKFFGEKIFEETGLQIIFEKDLDKIRRKNIIVIDANDEIKINNRVIL